MSTSGGVSTPGGAAGGDLAGTYPNPTVAKLNTTALGTLTGATNGQVLEWNGSAWVPSTISAGGGNSVYGDGSDGAQTFDGTTTILGVAPSSSTYTMNRDWFLASSTINVGVSIITNGFRLYCSGTLTNNGTIQWNGGAGGNGTGSAGGGAGAATNNNAASITASAAGQAGGAGVVSGAANAGTANTANALGGNGGHGGAGSSGAGGAGGGVTAPAGTVSSARSAPFAIIGAVNSQGSTWQRLEGGASAGGGNGDGTNGGGGGGGGGGIVIVVSKVIAGTGTISANGGAGGNGFTTGNTGGGGGGGGGIVVVVSSSVSAGAITGQTITANGGAHGTSNGTGGGLITAGSAGTTVVLNN